MTMLNAARYIFLSTLAAVLVPWTETRGEIHAYDGFSYSAGKPVSGLDGGSGFSGEWALSAEAADGNINRYITSSEQPAFTDARGRLLQTREGMLRAEVAGSGGAPLSRNLEQAMTGTFWISFLTRMDEQQGYGWQIMFADEPGEPQFQFFNGKSENNRWRIQSPKTGRTKPADGIFESRQGMLPTDPALVILRVQNAGSGNADGSILAYINPTDLRDPEISALGSVKISGLQLNAIKSFVFDKKTTTTGYIDELRFGETLEDVLPTE